MLYQIVKLALDEPEHRPVVVPLVRMARRRRVAANDPELRTAVIRAAYDASSGATRAALVRAVRAADERLADEMGLYTDDVDRLGMLSNEAFRAARLVVDPGLHALGWSRQQAIDYMLANTAATRGGIESEVDRYIAVPGQATAYLTGSLVIQELRAMAESKLGDRFDIREFHDRVIGDGTITLPMLQEKIERWIAELSEGPA